MNFLLQDAPAAAGIVSCIHDAIGIGTGKPAPPVHQDATGGQYTVPPLSKDWESPPMTRIALRTGVALILLVTQVRATASDVPSLDVARQVLDSGNASDAVVLYEALTRQGESLEAEIGLVRAALQAGEFRKAMSWATLVAGEHADSAEAVALLAYLQDRIGRTEQALAALEQLRAKEPTAAVAVAAQADILIDRLASENASQVLNAWVARNPHIASADLQMIHSRALAAGPAPNRHSFQHAQASGSHFRVWPRPTFEAFPAAGALAGSGNGLVVEEGNYVLTSPGVVPPGKSHIYVRNGLGKIRRAERVEGGENQGLVRLRLLSPFPADYSFPDEQITAPEGARFCFAFGFSVPSSPYPTYPAVVPGIVVRPDAGVGRLMQVTSALGAGHAGSPIFDPRGRLLGLATSPGEILIGGENLRARVGSGHFAVRAIAVRRDTPGGPAASPQLSGPQPPMPAVEELYERLIPSIVQIVVLDSP